MYKYRYKDIKEIPCIRSVKLCLNIKKRFDFKIILSDLTALEILSSNKCEILKAKKTVTPLKIRKNLANFFETFATASFAKWNLKTWFQSSLIFE